MTLNFKFRQFLIWLWIISPLWLMPWVVATTFPTLRPFLGWNLAGELMFASSGILLGLYILLHAFNVGHLLTVILAILVNFYYGARNSWMVIASYYPKFPPTIEGLLPFLSHLDLMYIASALLPLCATGGACLYVWNQRKSMIGAKGFLSGGRKRAKPSQDAPDTHGSARLSNLKEMRALNHPEGLPVGVMPTTRSFDDPQELAQSIRKRPGRDLLRIKADHTLVIAPTRSGKGIGVVVPTLLDYKGPVVVTDIKGENCPVTWRAREKMGREVLVFDPFELTEGTTRISINPLDFLNADHTSVVEDSETLANLLVPIPVHDIGNSKFFAEQAAALVQCWILYVVCDPHIADADKNLGEVYNNLCLNHKGCMTLLRKISQDKERAYGTLARLASSFLGVEEEQFSATLSTARQHLRFIDAPPIRSATSQGQFNLKDITTGLVDLYLCIPDEKLEVQGRLLRIICHIISVEMRRARGNYKALPLLMLLDELPAIGYMKWVDEALLYGAGYGIHVMGIAQTLEKLQTAYPQSWKTFLSSNLILLFGTGDIDTAKMISSMLGQRTILTSSSSQGESAQIKTGSSSYQEGQSYAYTARPLITPDEVLRLGNEVMLVIAKGHYPIMCGRMDYRTQPEYKGKFEENPFHKNKKAS
ncbi:MAG: type IV secretory system conjugative DNA transfer family protein [Alphaproteobacteria bacterium]|nr:type IV secretory system conjugative DNA transfer family protein [Alphaproteobacteria bacterium]